MAPSRPDRSRRVLLVVAVVLAVAVVALGAVLASLLVSGHQRPEVVDACRDGVLRQLKAPATARFSDEQVTEKDGHPVVNGVVDAQNGFGATIRNRYRCDAVPAGSGWTTGVTLTDWS